MVEELQVFRGLMPFLSSDRRLRWNLLASASDASANGHGVSTSMWTQEEFRQAGRLNGAGFVTAEQSLRVLMQWSLPV